MSKNPKIVQIVNDAGSSELTVANAAVEAFQKSGTLANLPEFLLNGLGNEHSAIRAKTRQLLFDIKDKSLNKVIFDLVHQKEFIPHRSTLLAALWEANLDCSDYLSELIALCASSDLQAIVEISTVIDNLEPNFSYEEIENYKLDLDELIQEEADEAKAQMLSSLMYLLDEIVE